MLIGGGGFGSFEMPKSKNNLESDRERAMLDRTDSEDIESGRILEHNIRGALTGISGALELVDMGLDVARLQQKLQEVQLVGEDVLKKLSEKALERALAINQVLEAYNRELPKIKEMEKEDFLGRLRNHKELLESFL